MNHVQTSLARAPYNIDDFGAYQAAALSVRDNLIVSYDLLGVRSSHAPSVYVTIIGIYCTFCLPLLLESQFQPRCYFLSTIYECEVLRADISQSR